MSFRVLFHVQHLLGTGHVRRAAMIADALADAGAAVTLASGGLPVANLRLRRATLVQLPAVRALDVSFKTLVDAAGRPIDAAWKAARRERLLALAAALRPDVVVTELFPFGRRMLEFELLPLLDAVRAAIPRPLVLSSVRDILAPASSETKAQTSIARVREFYDRVLVHGDASFVPLPESFPQAAAIAGRLAYTGYVQGPPGSPPPPGDGEGEVIVSVGGGPVGQRLLDAAAAARPLSREGHRRWRLLGGEARQAARPQPGLIVEPNRADFPGLLARCHVSVSLCGYNTVMDILTARVRSVVVPFAEGRETEQTQRAQALARHGWTQIVPEDELTPATLAAAIDRAAAMPRPAAHALESDGAMQTARLVREWLAAR